MQSLYQITRLGTPGFVLPVAVLPAITHFRFGIDDSSHTGHGHGHQKTDVQVTMLIDPMASGLRKSPTRLTKHGMQDLGGTNNADAGARMGAASR